MGGNACKAAVVLYRELKDDKSACGIGFWRVKAGFCRSIVGKSNFWAAYLGPGVRDDNTVFVCEKRTVKHNVGIFRHILVGSSISNEFDFGRVGFSFDFGCVGFTIRPCQAKGLNPVPERRSDKKPPVSCDRKTVCRKFVSISCADDAQIFSVHVVTEHTGPGRVTDI